MYHRQNTVNDKPFQNIEFYSLKSKSSQNIYTFQDNKIIADLNRQGVNMISILGLFYFATNPSVNEQIFNGMNLQQTPKIFQSFSHQKTMKFILRILTNRQFSQQSLMQLINEYPIVNFLIQAYCRALCIKEGKKQLQDSEKEIIQNFAYDLRGNLLDSLANCLQINLTLICGSFTQTFGVEKNPKKIQIKFTETKIEAEIINKKSNISYTRSIQSSGVKTLKQINTQQTQASESIQVSSIETNSLLKDTPTSTQIIKCQKCKVLKSRCYCTRRQVGSPYHTPSSASRLQKNLINNAIQSSIPSIGQGKCTCHKVFCTCRK